MGSLNPAASSSGDWRHQLNADARSRMRSTMLQTLRRYLPVQEVRRQNMATQIEEQCYKASANQSDYFKNIAAVIKHVEKQYQKYCHPAPSVPQQGNNPAHSSASILISQEQSQQPDNSTLVQASSLSSDDQSSTGGSQTSALHNTSEQSTATQSGIRHNSLNTVQQPVNQQFCVQQIERTQQSLQQPVTGELSNLHPNQPINLLNHHQTQEFMSSQPRHLNYATSYNEDGYWHDLQLPPLLQNFEFSEGDDTFSISEYLQDPDMTIADEEHGCFDSTGLASMEVSNTVLIADRPMNPKKRKCDSSSSAPVLR